MSYRVSCVFYFLLFFTVNAYIPVLNITTAEDERESFCDIAALFQNGTLRDENGNSIILQKALKGKKVLMGLNPPSKTNSFFMALNSSSGYPCSKFHGTCGALGPGFMFEIQELIAQKGEFEFEYIQMPYRGTGRTASDYTTYFSQILPYVHFFGPSQYADSADRRIGGISFSYPLVDASLYLVTTTSVSHKANDVWAFALPFVPGLWGIIILVFVFNAVVDWLIQGHDHESLSSYMYYSLMTLTTKSKFEPRHLKSKVLNYGVAFFAFVITASYIATLSSVLITKDVHVPRFTSIDDANAQSAQVCVESGSFAKTVLDSYKNIKQVLSPTDTVTPLAQGKCQAAIVAQINWDIYRQQKASDPNCNIVQVGSAIRVIDGAWPFKVDYNNKCVSFVNDVITALLIDLYTDGTITTKYTELLESSYNVTCSFEPGEEIKPPLGYENVSGVFIIYILCIGAGLILHGAKRFYFWKIASPEHGRVVKHAAHVKSGEL